MWNLFTILSSGHTKALLLLCTLVLASGINHKCFATENAFQMWTPTYMDFPLSRNQKLRGYIETNPRFNDEMQGFNQFIQRYALGYRIRPNLDFYQGYAYITNHTPKFIYENRIYQQLGYGHVFRKKLQFFHRFRNEQRFINVRDGTALRMRYMLRMAYPIRDTRFYLVGYDELFVNLNSLKGGPVSGIDQNRLFAGVGRQFNKHLRAEIGYQYQYINRLDPTADKAAHILLTQMFVNF